MNIEKLFCLSSTFQSFLSKRPHLGNPTPGNTEAYKESIDTYMNIFIMYLCMYTVFIYVYCIYVCILYIDGVSKSIEYF